MAKRKIAKILTDQEKHDSVQTDQMVGEQESEGSMPATGSNKAEESTLEEAHKYGLYEEATEEGEGEQKEVNIAQEMETQERKHKRGY